MLIVAHLHYNGTWDSASMITPDPTLVDDGFPDLSESLMTGIACRVITAREGECPCGSEVVRMNRRARRGVRWNALGIPKFNAYVEHRRKCLAMSGETRGWLYQNSKKIVA